MIEKVQNYVAKLLKENNDGHGINHIKRVMNLATKFAQIETYEKEIVVLIALHHDVDDYKLFGEENQKSLPNARKLYVD